MIRIMSALIFGLLTGLIFSGSSKDGYNELMDKVGVIFLLVINQTFSNVLPVLVIFLQEKPVVKKELASNSYPLSSYFMSKVISELPFDLINPICFIVSIYFFVDLDTRPEKFFLAMAILCVVSVTAVFLAYAITTVAPNFEIG